MGRYDGILLCTDFDNTVAVRTEVSQKNADAIRYFCDNGGIFSIISGRDVPFMKKYEEYLSLRSYVGCVNGTVLCHLPTEKVVKETFVPDGAREILIDVLGNLRDSLQDVNIFTSQGNDLIEYNDSFFDRVEAFEWKNVRKFVIHTYEPFTEQQLSYVRDTFGDKYITARSWPRGLEINNVCVDKGKTARHIAELVGAHTLVGAGDYENDITLLQAADIAYAVDNAIPELKAIADRVTVSASEDAIAAIIAEL